MMNMLMTMTTKAALNQQLIEKIIKTYDGSCPAFTYENPLLDHAVATALSKSLVKILRVSQANSNINNNLRHSILANIRKMCRIQPSNHVETDDTITSLLTEVFTEEISDPQSHNAIDPTSKILDEFLIHELIEIPSSKYHSGLNPEVAKSLIYLNDATSGIISRRVLSLNSSESSNSFVKHLWEKSSDGRTNICQISLKMKPEIEKNLLEACKHLLNLREPTLTDLKNTDKLKDLIEKCSISPKCYQICCGVLNDVFINSHFNQNIQIFIAEFVSRVKEMCPRTVSVLYCTELSHIVVLMDCDIKTLPPALQKHYILNTKAYLNKLYSESETNLVMLLSHFPIWFDIFVS